MDFKYIVLKIGDQVYSTDFDKGNKVEVHTRYGDDKYARKGEKCLWFQGFFTETRGHKKIEPISFEINIYYEE